jgi:hypothetical protein
MTIGEARRKYKELKKQKKLIEEGLQACREIILEAIASGHEMEDFYRSEYERYSPIGDYPEEKKESEQKVLDFFIQYGHTQFLKPDVTAFIREEKANGNLEEGMSGDLYWKGNKIDGLSKKIVEVLKEVSN